MLKRFLNKKQGNESFQIERSGDQFLVNKGVCFSTFSYGTGSFIPIKNTDTPFPFKDKEKFYIKFSVTLNLQVTGAEIRCERVGSDCIDGDCDWKNYPNIIDIAPQDEFDEKGRVKISRDGKRQLSCYTLIGIRSDDRISQDLNSSSSSSNTGIVGPIQILDTNIIMMASMFSGVPCVFPMPYFNGGLLDALYGDRFIPLNIEVNSSSSSSSSSSSA